METQTKSKSQLSLSQRATKSMAAHWIRILGLALLLFNLIAVAMPTQAAPVLDQEQTSATTSFDGDNASYTWQQGVRAGMTGQLTGVDLYVQTPGSAQFFVKTGGAPWQTGTEVFSATIFPAATGWYHIDIAAADILLGAEEDFVIGIQGTGGGLWLGSDASDVYARGALYLNEVSQTGDLAFRTYIEPISGTLDQQQLGTSTSYHTGSFLWQQGVKAAMAGKLAGVEVYVDQLGSARFFVKRGAPWQSSADLFSATISPAATGWYYIDLSSASITLDQEEDFVIGFQGGGSNLYIKGDGSAPYTRGQLYLDYGIGGPQSWGGDFAFRTYMVTPLEPELSIVKRVEPANAYPGDTITYTLTFSNAGGELVTGVTLTDSIPLSVTGTSVISSGVAITQTAPGYVWAVQNLDPNEAGIITITGVLNPDLPRGAITNTATMTGLRSSAESSVPVTVIHRPPTVSIAPIVSLASNLTTAISLNDPQGDPLSGTLEILSVPGAPVTATFETLATACGDAGVPLQLTLNGGLIGETYAPTNCSITPGVGAVDFTGPEIAANFIDDGDNTWAFNQAGGEQPYTAWARATLHYSDGSSQNACLFDYNGGDCTVTDLPSAGYYNGPLSGSAVLPALETVADSESYSNSELPFWLDVAGMAAGDYRLRVTASDGVDSGEDSEPFTLTGERRLYLSSPLIFAKSVAPADARPGAVITYTLSFSNVSAASLTGVVITDTIPVSVTNTSVISSGVGITQVAASRYVWHLGDLAAHTGGVIIVTGTLSDPLAAGAIFNSASIAAQGEVYDVRSAELNVLNLAPVADAGNPQTVTPGDEVTLDGSGSSDPNGDALTYGWMQTGGPTVTFTSTLSVTTFTAPDSAAVLTFTLTVTDSLGLADPTPAEVAITVSPVHGYYLPLIFKN